jgi:hypothetical protein
VEGSPLSPQMSFQTSANKLCATSRSQCRLSSKPVRPGSSSRLARSWGSSCRWLGRWRPLTRSSVRLEPRALHR